jgi:enoyl-CoA hydratase/carnithine racemase
VTHKVRQNRRENKTALTERNDTGAIAWITLNAPHNLNALSDAMIAALQAEFAALYTDDTIRVIVLRGTGKAFCAGHDLKEMTAARATPDGGAASFEDLFARCATLMQTIPALPQPVIAMVHGIATAAGCQLVASCDMAIAAEDAKFGVNGVNIGLFCSTPMVALSRNIPRKAAFELLTSGAFIDAQRALDLGLINRAVAPGDLEAETLALAQTVASKLGSAVRIGKQAFYEQITMPLDQTYEYTSAVIVENMLQQDTAEGINAFLEKRSPDWEQG